MIFTFSYRGKDYKFDDEQMGLGEARWIKKETGLVGMAFFDAVRAIDPDAIACLIVLAMRRAGETDATMDSISEDENGFVEFLESGSVTESAPKTGPKVTRRASAAKN